MEETGNENGLKLEKFTGFIFDLSLIILAFAAFNPIVELVANAPNLMVAISLISNCLAAGLILSAIINGAKLPYLWGFEGFLMVLTPASAFAMPLIYGFLAPSEILGNWVWSMPLVALFATLTVFGAFSNYPKATGKTFHWFRTSSAFIWLISTEAVIIAFVRFGVEDVSLGAAIIFMTFCWMPARLISAGVNYSRFEIFSAFIAYGLFLYSII